MRPSPRLLVALLALALLALPAGTAAAKRKPPLEPVAGKLRTTWGIADQKAGVFSDVRFAGLGFRTARRSVAWDALQHDWQVADIDAWMAAARTAGVTPLITFARSRISSRRHLVPTAAQMRTAFVAFRERYPWVTEFVASNESNHFGEPTGRRPALAVAYYKTMRSACPACKIAAATLLDYPNMVAWARTFTRIAKEQPRFWALHNYVSANRFDLSRTRRLLLTVRGEVWVTEVGGMVANRTPSRPGKAKLEKGAKHAARVTSFIFRRVARLSPRIRRIYLYHWSSEGPAASWDSGFVDHVGRPRPALAVLERELRAARAGRLRRGAAR